MNGRVNIKIKVLNIISSHKGNMLRKGNLLLGILVGFAIHVILGYVIPIAGDSFSRKGSRGRVDAATCVPSRAAMALRPLFASRSGIARTGYDSTPARFFKVLAEGQHPCQPKQRAV